MVAFNGYIEGGGGGREDMLSLLSVISETACRILASNKMSLLLQHKFLILSIGIYGKKKAWKELIVINLSP